ncbi:hypothetical protein ABEB36_003338 [Hypothenemus hampei]|uniref:Enolase-phosphatase E1 n=1 Tax=Hypothenemus hampei TaxID=57062 RepID=A0ABD1FAM6_HYPHA
MSAATEVETATFEKCSIILVDVLGTTTSLNFAKETLFPFVTKNAEEVLKSKWEEDSVKEAVKQLKEGEEEIDLDTAVNLIKELTESNSENPGLKTLQGIIYAKGYESGDLKAHVFNDVPVAFEAWAKTKKIAVYSTGSIESQKQLFTNSVEGDLSGHISKYFDQSVGVKTDSDSYKNIVEDLKVKPEEVLFLTDLIEEAKAAKAAGLFVAVITREGNPKLTDESKDFTVVSSFKEIVFENPAKRKNAEEAATNEEPPSKLPKTEETATIQEEKTTETVETEAMEVDNVSKDEKTDTKPVEEVKSEPVKSDENTENSKAELIETSVDAEPAVEQVKQNDNNESDKKEENEIGSTNQETIENKSSADSIEDTVDQAKPDDKDAKPTEVLEVSETVKEVEKPAEVSTTEEKSETKVEEEKENIKDLANAQEKGDEDVSTKKSNGEASVEVNGDPKTTEELNGKDVEDEKATSADDKIEEIQVKKAEASATSAETPAVSVEV